MAFDLSDMLSEVSKLDTSEKPQMEYIDIDLIDANDANFYELSNLKPLADSIAMDGLQQPLIVMPNGDRYTLLSGHRRRAALQLLVNDAEEPREDLRKVPCIKRVYKSAAMAELQLILANSTARVLTSAETMRQAERLEMVLYQLKEEGHEFPGRMRDQVAAACKVSASKLARLKMIREKLENPFLEQFEADKLSEQAAYNMARLPMEVQWTAAEVLGKKIIAGSAAENLAQHYEKIIAARTCTYGIPGETCDNVRGRIKATACSQYGYQYCSGGCCMSCYRADSCPGVCPNKKKALKEAKEKSKQDQLKAQKEQEKTWAKNRKLTQANAKRYVIAADAAGLSDDAKLKFSQWGPTTTLSDVRKAANGEGLEDKAYYSPGYDPDKNIVIDFAKQFGCSTDYLLGLTDELKPAAPAQPAGWQPGNPPKACQCVAKVQLPGLAETRTMLLAWDGYRWRFSHGAAIEAECKGWIALPEDE